VAECATALAVGKVNSGGSPRRCSGAKAGDGTRTRDIQLGNHIARTATLTETPFRDSYGG